MWTVLSLLITILLASMANAVLTTQQTTCLQSNSCAQPSANCYMSCFGISQLQANILLGCYNQCGQYDLTSDCSRTCDDQFQQQLGSSIGDINATIQRPAYAAHDRLASSPSVISSDTTAFTSLASTSDADSTGYSGASRFRLTAVALALPLAMSTLQYL